MTSTESNKQQDSSSLYVRKSSGLVRAISARNALISNLIGMGIIVNIFWVVFASALYPTADLPTTVFLGLGLSLLIAFVYWMLATAMPRTGGDYIYVSRIFHPSLGFLVNAMFVGIMISWAGLFPFYTAAQALPIMLSNLARSTGNSAYANAAAWLTSGTTPEFEVGAVIVTIVIASLFLPTRWFFRVMLGMFAVQAVIYVWFIGALATTSHAAFVSGFNSGFGGGVTYNAVISAAGVNSAVTIGGTLVGIVYTMLSYVGYANSAYFAGELKGDPKRSQGIAIFAAPIIFAVLIYILYAAIENVFGHSFLVAASTLATSTTSNIWTSNGGLLPTPAYLVSFISSNPVFTAAVPFALVLTFVGFAMIYFFIPVRNIFAWSFDRIIPAKFADITSSGVPWVAVLFYGAIAYISLYASVYTPFLTYLTYSNLGWWIAVAVVMFAAAAFPFVKKDLYNNAPSIVRRKIGSLPLITLVGGLGGLLSLYVSYTTTLPSYTGISVSYFYIETIAVIFVVALIIYGISYAYNKSRGLPIELISKELPPE